MNTLRSALARGDRLQDSVTSKQTAFFEARDVQDCTVKSHQGYVMALSKAGHVSARRATHTSHTGVCTTGLLKKGK